MNLQATKLGFKSVAHYLIQTRREGAIESLTDGDEKEGSSDALPLSVIEEHGIAEVMEQDSDLEFEGDEHDEEQDDN